MTTRRLNHLVLAVAGGLLAAPPLVAQGSLSTQGFGYPQGQLPTVSLSMGGATAEAEPTGPLNPAAMARLQTRTVLFQIEPEYRTIVNGNTSEHTTTARYPLIFVGVPFAEHWVTSVSSSTLLDRSWETSSPITEIIGPDTVATTLRETSNGAINDLQLAGGWTDRKWLYIGAAIHGITGRNIVTAGQDFDDSSHFSTFSSNRTLSYRGLAYSAGVQMVSENYGVIGIDYRKGGTLRERNLDSTLVSGTVPDHFGVSAVYTHLKSMMFAVRAGHDSWSSLSEMLETPGQTVHDSWDLGIGAEAQGPHWFQQTIPLRVGLRTRMLPFEASSQAVTERSASLGTGLSMGHDRLMVDAGLVRQWRTADVPGITERAWTFSLSLTARP